MCLHDFVIVVPVADRPRQLADCLDSLAGLLQRFPYAGAVSVLIVDDSLEPAAIARHRALADTHTRAGLPTRHLDRAAQRALVQDLPAALRERLGAVLGRPEADHAERIGPSASRNLACLWLSRLPRRGRKRLFWFVDSDERFRVEVETATGGTQSHDLDYLHTLDRLFTERPIDVLTGRVVGDPPVSPAVMALTLLDDVLTLLADLSEQQPHTPCRYHGHAVRAGDAAYHDMADLFGYSRPAAMPYRCPLRSTHDHAACLAHFAAGLGQFFDGVHPTRRSLFEIGQALTLTPARTVYTGNYVISESALAWFIPYASLRLRMAGPTLGRLLRAELGERFVCANLPLWHGRTLADLGRSECRPGIVHGAGGVDLSGEFERQYFGDVMLFTLEALTGLGYPGKALDDEVIRRELAAVEARMHARYLSQQTAIAERIRRFQAMLEDDARWWRQEAATGPAQEALTRFMRDLGRNFGPHAPPWRRISAPAYREARLDEICVALARYADERAAWLEALHRA